MSNDLCKKHDGGCDLGCGGCNYDAGVATGEEKAISRIKDFHNRHPLNDGEECECEFYIAIIRKQREDARIVSINPELQAGYKIFAKGFDAGAEATENEILEVLRKRQADLASCSKDDDCYIRAKAVDVAIADIQFRMREDECA